MKMDKPALMEAYTASQTTLLYMKRLDKTESSIFVVLLFCVLYF